MEVLLQLYFFSTDTLHGDLGIKKMNTIQIKLCPLKLIVDMIFFFEFGIKNIPHVHIKKMEFLKFHFEINSMVVFLIYSSEKYSKSI